MKGENVSKGGKQLISQVKKDPSLRQVDNTYYEASKVRNYKTPAAKYEVEDMSDILPADPSDLQEEEIIEESLGGNTREKFQARVAKADVLINIGVEDYD